VVFFVLTDDSHKYIMVASGKKWKMKRVVIRTKFSRKNLIVIRFVEKVKMKKVRDDGGSNFIDNFGFTNLEAKKGS
jgi:hypothetical protein